MLPPAASPLTWSDPLEQTTQALRSELTGIFQVSGVRAEGRGQTIIFSGRFLHDPGQSYDEIRRRFRAYGYTPLLRRQHDLEMILALEGVGGGEQTGNPLINLLLLLTTILTTLHAGAVMAGNDLFNPLLTGSVAALGQAISAGAPYALALLVILGVHEIGHYLAAQAHNVRATLPYFIPLPFGGLGTLGAFIAIKSPMKSRKVLFDIGLAGPYAGFLVAVPLLAIGLLLSTAYVPTGFPSIWTTERLGASLLFGAFLERLTDVPADQTLLLHPIARAAWLGFFLTGINLLPVGQLDGGHAVYAILGRAAHGVSLLVFGLLILAGAVLSTNWFVWAFFIMFGGLRHPPPLNDLSGVGRGRKLVGLATVLLFLLIVIPVPFR
ncbi:MAG: site-2 protease family protein [Candidatus Promineifilaceae bacterium]|nr:site-2 protease family protein [Candidatus Promineifilaceae bacterium]